MSQEFTNYLENLINKNKFVNGEITFGKLNNNFFNYNINKKSYYTFKNFINKKYKQTTFKEKVYQYYDYLLVSKDDKSHVCFRLNYTDFKYDINNNLSICYKTNNNYILDNINFPTIEKYHSEFNKEYEKYSIKYKNSIINIEFIEINNNILSIKFIFNLNQKNLENFKINLSFLLKKLFHNFN
jgi:hypothetical protein